MPHPRFQRYRSLNSLRKDGFFPYLLSRCFAGKTRERLSAGKRLCYVQDRAAAAKRHHMLGR